MINISRRALALLIALLLALPIPAFAEDEALPAADAPAAEAPAEAPAADAPADADADEAPEETGEAPDADDVTDADDAPAYEIPVSDPFEPEVAEGPELELSEADDGEQSDVPPGEDELPAVELPAEAEVAGARGDDDGEALLDAYVQRMIDESLGMTAPPLFAASASLTGIDGVACDILKSEVARVAEGDRSDTVFVLTEEMLRAAGFNPGPWTAADLGMSTTIVKEGHTRINPDALNAIQAATTVSTGKVNQAILADCPCELYWYDKTSGMLMSIPSMYVGARWNGTEYELYYTSPFSITFKMPVSKGYQGADEYTVDAARVTAAKEAIATARTIVENHSALSVRERLAAFKNEICERVSYNYDAANNGLPYGDPWQLIYVFDGDPDTKVVCEGYSKAFKYLFDLSDFGEPYDCLLAVGTINDRGHMWNIVHMEDDRNYLVDVTNCDSSSGPTDRLFMAYGPTGSLDEGYSFGSTRYNYSDSARATFSDAQLTLSAHAYSTVQSRISIVDGISHGTVDVNPTEAYSGEIITLTFTSDTGYEPDPDSLRFCYNDGADRTQAIGPGHHFFMPAFPVTVYAAFRLIPAIAPTFSAQPQGLSLTYGQTENAALHVGVNPIEGHTLTYQWYESDTDSAAGGTAIDGETAADLTVVNPGLGTTYYYCTVTATRIDNGQTATATTAPASVRVDMAPAPPAADAGETPAVSQAPTVLPIAAPQILTIAAPGNTKAPAQVGNTYQIDTGSRAGKRFKSSNKKVATVTASGLVIPKKPGKAKITFKVGKKKRTVTLTVTDPTIPKRVTLSAAGPLSGKKGGTTQLIATLPENTVSAIRWTSSNKRVATVNANGLVTFKKPGKATITATCARGKKKARVKVRVVK